MPRRAGGRDDGRPGGALEPALAPSSWCLRHIDQTSGAYRSMSAPDACCSLLGARVIRSEADRSPGIWSALTCAGVLPPVIALMFTPPGSLSEVSPVISQNSTIKLSFIVLIKVVGGERQRSGPGVHVRPMAQHQVGVEQQRAEAGDRAGPDH